MHRKLIPQSESFSPKGDTSPVSVRSSVNTGFYSIARALCRNQDVFDFACLPN